MIIIEVLINRTVDSNPHINVQNPNKQTKLFEISLTFLDRGINSNTKNTITALYGTEYGH